VQVRTSSALLESAQADAILKYLFAILMFVVLALSQVGGQVSVRSISVVSDSPLQLRIQTSGRVTPQAQMVSSPERLVIDIPNAIPGTGLRGITVHGSEVNKVRVSLFTAKPPTTRIVVDLAEPQWYRVAPDASGLLVSFGSDPENTANTRPTIGWVSGGVSPMPVRRQGGALIVQKSAVRQAQPLAKNSVSVEFANGLLTIHSTGATLSEVLFQIQKQTGAEIAIPSGTEQDRVASDFGPGSPSEVLGELLNGSGLNFVVVGSEADPRRLRSVILSRESGGVSAPQADNPAYTPPGFAENTEPQSPEGMAPPPEDPQQPQQLSPDRQPPPGPPPDAAPD
jgi:hypothetical protein